MSINVQAFQLVYSPDFYIAKDVPFLVVFLGGYHYADSLIFRSKIFSRGGGQEAKRWNQLKCKVEVNFNCYELTAFHSVFHVQTKTNSVETVTRYS